MDKGKKSNGYLTGKPSLSWRVTIDLREGVKGKEKEEGERKK